MTSPDVPTIGETGPGFDPRAFICVVAPEKTPPDIVQTEQGPEAASADAKMQEALRRLRRQPCRTSPDGFGKLVKAETEKWAKVVKTSAGRSSDRPYRSSWMKAPVRRAFRPKKLRGLSLRRHARQVIVGAQ